jgi:hypothetical protein
MSRFNKKQCLPILASNATGLILLYLRGGPGEDALHLAAKCNKRLEGIFAVAALERRGGAEIYNAPPAFGSRLCRLRAAGEYDEIFPGGV